jgi:hypothetical protein
MGDPKGKNRRNPLLGAAVLKALLRRPAGESRQQTGILYEGVLRDLSLTDADVEEYLLTHEAEVERAIRSHGRRGD